MYEIDALADKVSVFRNGRHIETFAAGSRSRDAMIGLMVGQPLKELFPERIAPPSAEVPPILSCRGLRWSSVLDGIDLDVRPGEIIGLGGLDGQASTACDVHAIFGVLRRLEGTAPSTESLWRHDAGSRQSAGDGHSAGAGGSQNGRTDPGYLDCG